MPFRFRRSFKAGPLRLNIGKHGISSVNVGPVNLRKGHAPRLSVPIGGGLSYTTGGERRRRIAAAQTQPQGAGCLLYALAVLFPPAAVLLCGKPLQALLCAGLMLFGWVPGVLHALIVVSRRGR